MAIFNAPLLLEDHEFCAVKTAWEMKVKGEELAERLYQRYNKDIRFGIGINTGDAIIGNIGSKTRMDYTAIGDSVNIAARLESNAQAGQIIISQATYEKVKDRILVRDLGAIKVKGKQTEINAYQVMGLI
jgi:adenylate cyclase